MLAVFIIGSFRIIQLGDYGSWLYVGLSIYLFARFHNPELVRSIFPNKVFRTLRLLEAIVYSLPFSIMLVLTQSYLQSMALPLLAMLSSQLNLKIRPSFTIPTPFYKYPFEFTVGFRRSWLLIMVCYILCAIGASVNNFNLSIFSVAVLYLTLLLFYTKPEDESFVWMHTRTPGAFLTHKVKIAILYSVLSSLPMIVAVMIFFTEQWLVIASVSIGGLLLPITGLLNKYAHYPYEAEFINAILIGSCLLFPPLFLIIVPFLANKALANLKTYL